MIVSRRKMMVCIAAIAGSASSYGQDAAPRPILIYFGATNCPVCRDWKRFELPKLKETEGFKAARFVEILKEIPAPIPPADRFPQDLAPMRDAISDRFKGKIGSPMFAIVVGDKVTWTHRGAPSSQLVADALQSSRG